MNQEPLITIPLSQYKAIKRAIEFNGAIANEFNSDLAITAFKKLMEASARILLKSGSQPGYENSANWMQTLAKNDGMILEMLNEILKIRKPKMEDVPE